MKKTKFLAVSFLMAAAFSVHAGTTSYFIYDEAGHVIGEYDSSGNPIQEHVYLGDRPVAVVQGGSSSGGTVDYVTTDQLNTPRVITDSSQTVLWSWNSDPFGSGNPTGSIANNQSYNLRFPGQYYDQETGHDYNYERDYDPSVGRYIESDPFGLAGGVDTYLYANANPLSWMDIYGLCPDCRKNCLDTYKRQVTEAYDTYKKAWNFCTKWFAEWSDKFAWAATGVGCRPSANQGLELAIKAAQVVRDRCLANCQQGEENGERNGAMSATPGGGGGLPGP